MQDRFLYQATNNFLVQKHVVKHIPNYKTIFNFVCKYFFWQNSSFFERFHVLMIVRKVTAFYLTIYYMINVVFLHKWFPHATWSTSDPKLWSENCWLEATLNTVNNIHNKPIIFRKMCCFLHVAIPLAGIYLKCT